MIAYNIVKNTTGTEYDWVGLLILFVGWVWYMRRG